jgi:hypothetical protein
MQTDEQQQTYQLHESTLLAVVEVPEYKQELQSAQSILGCGPRGEPPCSNVGTRILIFFALDPKLVSKTGKLRCGSNKIRKKWLVKSLVIHIGVKPEGKKYLPDLSRYLGKIRDSLTGSDKVRPILGSFPPDLGLTSLGCQNRKGYLKTSSNSSFHTFRLSLCQSSCRVVNRSSSGLRVVFVLELLY